MDRTIEQVRNAKRLSAGNGNTDTTGHRTARRAGARRLHGRSRQNDQVRRLPAIERQRLDALVFYDGPDTRAASFNERGGRFNADRLGKIAQRHRDVDDRVRIHLQHEARADEGAEAGEHRLDAIGAEGQIRKREQTVRVSDRRPLDACLRLNGGHVHARQDGTLGIRYDASDLCGRLCVRRRRAEQTEQRECHEHTC